MFLKPNPGFTYPTRNKAIEKPRGKQQVSRVWTEACLMTEIFLGSEVIPATYCSKITSQRTQARFSYLRTIGLDWWFGQHIFLPPAFFLDYVLMMSLCCLSRCTPTRTQGLLLECLKPRLRLTEPPCACGETTYTSIKPLLKRCSKRIREDIWGAVFSLLPFLIGCTKQLVGACSFSVLGKVECIATELFLFFTIIFDKVLFIYCHSVL